jgi:hypothetical protein
VEEMARGTAATMEAAVTTETAEVMGTAVVMGKAVAGKAKAAASRFP